MEKFFLKLLARSKATSFIELGRPWNGVLTGLFALLGTAIGGLYDHG